MTERGDGPATTVDRTADRITELCAEIKRLLASLEEQARQLKDEASDE